MGAAGTWARAPGASASSRRGSSGRRSSSSRGVSWYRPDPGARCRAASRSPGTFCCQPAFGSAPAEHVVFRVGADGHVRVPAAAAVRAQRTAGSPALTAGTRGIPCAPGYPASRRALAWFPPGPYAVSSRSRRPPPARSSPSRCDGGQPVSMTVLTARPMVVLSGRASDPSGPRAGRYVDDRRDRSRRVLWLSRPRRKGSRCRAPSV